MANTGPLTRARGENRTRITGMIATGLIATPIANGRASPMALPMVVCSLRFRFRGGGRNRTHRTGITRPTRFEDEGGHQTPFTSGRGSTSLATIGAAPVDQEICCEEAARLADSRGDRNRGSPQGPRGLTAGPSPARLPAARASVSCPGSARARSRPDAERLAAGEQLGVAAGGQRRPAPPRAQTHPRGGARTAPPRPPPEPPPRPP